MGEQHISLGESGVDSKFEFLTGSSGSSSDPSKKREISGSLRMPSEYVS